MIDDYGLAAWWPGPLLGGFAAIAMFGLIVLWAGRGHADNVLDGIVQGLWGIIAAVLIVGVVFGFARLIS